MFTYQLEVTFTFQWRRCDVSTYLGRYLFRLRHLDNTYLFTMGLDSYGALCPYTGASECAFCVWS